MVIGIIIEAGMRIKYTGIDDKLYLIYHLSSTGQVGALVHTFRLRMKGGRIAGPKIHA